MKGSTKISGNGCSGGAGIGTFSTRGSPPLSCVDGLEGNVEGTSGKAESPGMSVNFGSSTCLDSAGGLLVETGVGSSLGGLNGAGEVGGTVDGAGGIADGAGGISGVAEFSLTSEMEPLFGDRSLILPFAAS